MWLWDTWNNNTHKLNTKKPESSFIWVTLSVHNTDAIEFRLCVSLLSPFARLSIIGIWPLCKQCNSTTNPPIFTSLQRDPKERGALTIHEWKVTQLLLLIQAYLFNLWGNCIVSRRSATIGHIKNRVLWHNEEACTKNVFGSLAIWDQDRNIEAPSYASSPFIQNIHERSQFRLLCIFNRLCEIRAA